ncbi:MAG: hypothetical protein ACE14M_06060 [Terriglobales bacterium]
MARSRPLQNPERPRRTYKAPRVSRYGHVAQLTRGGGGNGKDASTMHTKQCWIAEALYGVDAPRTLLVRAWLSECYGQHQRWARIVVPLYRRFGMRMAGIMARIPMLKAPVRPLFDRAARLASRSYVTKLLLSKKPAA